jgi:hypothetical protein
MDKKISELDAATALTGTEVAPLVQSGGNVKATIQQITTAVTGATGTNGETVTTDKPRLDLTQTWNAVGTTFTGLKFNATDTASAAASMLASLQVGGTNIFGVRRADFSGTRFNRAVLVLPQNSYTAMLTGGFFSFGVDESSSNVLVEIGTGSGIVFQANSPISWTDSASNAVAGNKDLVLRRDGAADTLAQRRSTNAQTFRIYNTFTDASNYERGKMEWASNVLRIGTENAGTGTARALEFQTDGTTRLAINATGAANFFGSSFLVANTAFGGGQAATLTFGHSTNGASLQSSIRCVLPGDSTSTLDFYTFSTSSTLKLSISGTGLVRFQGTTSSFPALKRDTVRLQARLADDSAFTNIQGKLTTETAYTAGAPTATGYLVLYDSNGTAYKVPAEAL